MADKPILCLDFDGVINSYSKGWNNGILDCPVVPGFFEWATEARKHFRLIVYSSRSNEKDYLGIDSMSAWMIGEFELWKEVNNLDSFLWHDDYYDKGKLLGAFEFAIKKPPAFLTIDDRAIQFRGDWKAWWLDPQKLLEFKPWTQPGADQCDASEEKSNGR